MTNITLVLIITGTVVIAGYFIFKLLINLYRKPILGISLSALDNPRWSDIQKITDLIDSLLRNGFESAGNYKCWEIPSLIIAGFIRPSDQLMGIIYDHPMSGIWVDFCVQYTDGSGLTVSNAPMGHELDHMSQHTMIYSKGSSADELLVKVLTERKQSGRVTITKEEFASFFENQYQKEMKWRMDRGGPTHLEVMRVANKSGESLDSEELQNATQKIQKIWMKEKNRPKKNKKAYYGADLPEEFQRPETFRQIMEQHSAPIPQLNVSALPVYLVFISALAYWCYYGYQYNEIHGPVSLTALIVFFSVFLGLFIIMMSFREYHRRVKMCPMLKRMAGLRPGTFLVITGSTPSLFYAREKWIGKVSFVEGSENENACTCLKAVTKHSLGSLAISRKNILNKVIWGSDKETIPLPESDFSRKFTVSGTDTEFAEKQLNPSISDAILRLEEFGQPFVEIERNLVSIEFENDLSLTRKEALLRKFLEEAERIIEAMVRQADPRP